MKRKNQIGNSATELSRLKLAVQLSLTTSLPNHALEGKPLPNIQNRESFKERVAEFEMQRFESSRWLDDPVMKLRVLAADADEKAERAGREGKHMAAARLTRAASELDRKADELAASRQQLDPGNRVIDLSNAFGERDELEKLKKS